FGGCRWRRGRRSGFSNRRGLCRRSPLRKILGFNLFHQVFINAAQRLPCPGGCTALKLGFRAGVNSSIPREPTAIDFGPIVVAFVFRLFLGFGGWRWWRRGWSVSALMNNVLNRHVR